MNLHNGKGDEFRLQILGYQFPEILGSYWDSNWLKVQVSGANSTGQWSVEDPCLLTFEVETLAAWLEKLFVDNASEKYISFAEPSPQFRVIKHKIGKFLLRVDIGYIFRKKMPEVFGKRKTIHLYFPLDEIDLPAQALSLRRQLQEYPQRVFR